VKYRAVLKFYDEGGLTKTVPIPDARFHTSRYAAVQDLMDYVRTGGTPDVPEGWAACGNDIQQRS